MKLVLGLFLLLICSGCLVAEPETTMVRDDHHHDGAGEQGFTQHYDKSFFQISENGGFSVELVAVAGAFVMGDNSIDLIIHDRSDRDVSGAVLTLTPWMPLHGHGSPETPVLLERGGGLYTVKNLYLPMAGPWEMRVTIADKGVQDKTTFLVPVSMTDEVGSSHQHKNMDASSVDFKRTRSSEKGIYSASFTVVNGDTVSLNQMQQWTIHLDDAIGMPVVGAKVKVNGGMPEHGHGLPTEPMITEDLGDGDYMLEGLKFTMLGWWEVVLQISADDGDDVITFNLNL